MKRERPTDRIVDTALRDLGQHLRGWRRLNGLTQAQVAERAGVSRGVITRLEAGGPGVTLDGFVRVLRALHITDELTEALDPLNSDRGRLRATELLDDRATRRQQ